MQNKPWKVGIVRGGEDFSQEKVQAHEKRVSDATNLADLAEDYQFFTPALMYLHVRMLGRDPLPNFIDEYGKDAIPISLRFDKPVFRGLEIDGNPIWNHYLYGLEKEHFGPYISYLGTTAFVDRELGYVARVRTRELKIADPLYLKKLITTPLEIPLVSVVALCLDSNKGCRYIEEDGEPTVGLPVARYVNKVYKDTMLFAQAVLGEHDNPYQLMEEGMAEDGVATPEQEIRQRVKEAREKQ